MGSFARTYEGFIGSCERIFSAARGVIPLRAGIKRHRSRDGAAPSTNACRSARRWFMSTRASSVVLIGLAGACSPSTYLSNVKQTTVDYCVRKSCTGPSVSEARDYQRCEATCRERFGQ